MLDPDRQPAIGDIVFRFDDNRLPTAAIVVHVWPEHSKHIKRPFCNLTTFLRNGRFTKGLRIGPVYHDGAKFHLTDKWAFRDEIPEEEWIHAEAAIETYEDMHKKVGGQGRPPRAHATTGQALE